MTKAFEEAVISGEGEEYKLYTRLMKEYPGITVIRKTHKSPTVYNNKKGPKTYCNQFKNLTYKNMERFIEAIPNHEPFLKEFKFLEKKASKLQTNGYKVVREWFVAQFPEYRNNPAFYLYHTPNVINAAELFKDVAAEAEKEDAA